MNDIVTITLNDNKMIIIDVTSNRYELYNVADKGENLKFLRLANNDDIPDILFQNMDNHNYFMESRLVYFDPDLRRETGYRRVVRKAEFLKTILGRNYDRSTS